MTTPGLLRLAPDDDVLIAVRTLGPGLHGASDGDVIEVAQEVDLGHKVAAHDLALGDLVVRYGMPIGVTTERVRRGEWVHTHNLASRYIDTFAHRGGSL